jgi:hypothetical protein
MAVCVLVVSSGLCGENLEFNPGHNKLIRDSSIAKVIQAAYRTVENQTFLTIFMAAHLLNKNAPSYPLASLYGTWVLVREFIGQLEQSFEGTFYESNRRWTCFKYLLLSVLFPLENN